MDDLSTDDLRRLIDALDSHMYWQLSDPHYRNNGDVRDPGSDDAEARAELEACRTLAHRLIAAHRRKSPPVRS